MNFSLMEKIKYAKSYQIQYADNKKFKKKKTYYIRVRAYKLDGSKKVYGSWSKVKKIKVKK